ncbi:MAG: MFS transporter [Reyranella sp.]|nr:MFS transporter [Reyranella sp.]
MPTPSSPSRWTMLALLFAARVGLGFQFQTMGSVADPLAQHLHLSFTEIGTLIGLFMMPGLVLAIPAGLAGRYVADRKLVASGLLALAIGGAVSSLAEGFGLLALGRLLCGVGFVVTSIYFTKMVVDWFAGRELATAMAILVMSWPFGIALGQIVHGQLAVLHGWPGPFMVAALYCLAAAALVFVAYRPPPVRDGAAPIMQSSTLTQREWILILLASAVWAFFNAAYVVYLSFAPRMLIVDGIGPLQAASIISLASWVMIFSGALCGQIADRTGRSDLVLYVCLCCAMASLALLPNTGWAVPLSLAFGLLGMAPAGLIVALTGAAMAPNKRAFGMGVYSAFYFLLSAPAPAIAGWLFDRTDDAFVPILFAILLFALTLVMNLVFRAAQRATAPV